MPEVTALYITLVVLAVAIAAIIGWLLRGQRSTHEKLAINASWQEQIDSHRNEQQRLIEQNKTLMNQVSHLQASSEEARKRARELSRATQLASTRRDDLQREIRDVRSSLEAVLTERKQLQSDIATQVRAGEDRRQKDETIRRLSRELDNWHKRVPPLIERYRVRNAEALRLESDLAAAQRRLEQLENARSDGATRIEPVRDPARLTDGRGASNDPSEGQLFRHDDSHKAPAGGEYRRALRDDLQVIKGIGPSIERTLNELGLFRYQQLADLSENDIDRIAERLKGFHKRIYRENWIGQARGLAGGGTP
ncbi:MAG: hypothetical protein HKN64_02405 [Woeseiaceae bacterium]|nr:hypothetical protein [Woeseiaceae bacterium]